MNQASDRESPGASHTLSCHWISRLVLVTVPAFSGPMAEGRKNTSVPTSSGRSSPRCTRRPFCQNSAVSVMAKSRTTIQSSFDSARSTRSELTLPTTGFWPRTNSPFTAPWFISSDIGCWEWSPVIFGSRSKPKLLSSCACSPYQAFSSETMYFGKLCHQPLSGVSFCRKVLKSVCACIAFGWAR